MDRIGMYGDGTPRPFRLVEIEPWPGCLEVIVEGGLGPRDVAEFEDCLLRFAESEHEHVLVDLTAANRSTSWRSSTS